MWRVEDPLGTDPDLFLEAPDHAGREAGADEPPDPVVRRRILRDEHDTTALRRERHDSRAIVRGERLPVAIRLFYLPMSEHGPELDVAPVRAHMRPRVPEDRSHLALLCIQLVRHPVPIQGRIEEVDMGHFGDSHVFSRHSE